MTHTRTESTLSSRSEWSLGELILWKEGLSSFDSQQFPQALQCFSQCEHRAKVLYNIAMCRWSESEESIELVIDDLKGALEQDPYLAIAGFQLGCACFKLKNIVSAVDAFQSALRGENDLVQLTKNEIFRPSALRLGALDPQDYLGAALIVAVANPTEHIGRIHVKCLFEHEMRMFAIESSDLRMLRQAIMNKYCLPSRRFQMKYQDEEGDWIVLCDDEDLSHAVRDRFLRVQIYMKDDNSKK